MKKLIGITTLAISLMIAFQSYVFSLKNSIEGRGEFGGIAGLILSAMMLIAGLIILLSKSSNSLTLMAVTLFMIGGLIAITNVGSYSFLLLWSLLSFLFGFFTLILLQRNKNKVSNK